MLTPSYSEIMDVLNRDCDPENKVITSRYSVVIAAAKRARQIVAGAHFDASGAKTDKAVSIAINELGAGHIRIYPEGLPDAEITPRSEGYGLDAQYRAFYGGGIKEDWSVTADDDDGDDEAVLDEAAEGAEE